MEHYVERYHDETDPDDVALYQAVQGLFNRTTHPAPIRALGYSNWLTKYATEYRYNRAPRHMDRSEKLELQTLVNQAMNRLTEKTLQVSGTSESDVFPDGKPWE